MSHRPETRWRRLRRRWKGQPGIVPWLLALPQRAFFRFLGLLPWPLSREVGACLGRLALLSRRRRAIGLANLRLALPELGARERRRLLRRSCAHLGRTAAEAVLLVPRFTAASPEAWIAYEEGAEERLEAVRGRAPVFFQAHLGAPEMAIIALLARGLAPATPTRPPRNHYLARDLASSRNRGGVLALPRQGALRRMLRHQAEGGALVFTADQNAHHQPLFVPWFGRRAATERAPAALALRGGGPVLVSWCLRVVGERPYRFGCRLVRPGGNPIARPAESDLRELLLACHGALQEVVRAHPEQYLWIHDRYRTRPPEEEE